MRGDRICCVFPGGEGYRPERRFLNGYGGRWLESQTVNAGNDWGSTLPCPAPTLRRNEMDWGKKICKCGNKMTEIQVDGGWLYTYFNCLNCGRLFRMMNEFYKDQGGWLEHKGLREVKHDRE